MRSFFFKFDSVLAFILFNHTRHEEEEEEEEEEEKRFVFTKVGAEAGAASVHKREASVVSGNQANIWSLTVVNLSMTINTTYNF